MKLFWNLNQLKVTFSLIFIFLIIKFLPEPLENEKNNQQKTYLNEYFYETIKDAGEAIEYLYKMQKNQAEIESVVENPRNIKFIKKCDVSQIEKQFYLNNRTENWVQVDDGLFLFSAYFDYRKNSLFVNHNSIQVIDFNKRFFFLKFLLPDVFFIWHKFNYFFKIF